MSNQEDKLKLIEEDLKNKASEIEKSMKVSLEKLKEILASL